MDLRNLPRPRRAILLARISDDRINPETGEYFAEGVTEQIADLRAHADRIGWGIGLVISENDTSAFKKRRVRQEDGTVRYRTVRPEFQRALRLLRAKAFDGLMAVDLDRATRDPFDLEDLIDVAENYHIQVTSITGSLRLDTDADITMARVLVAVANKASRDTARRVANKRIVMAQEGRWGGGPRRFGWEANGFNHQEDEARLIREAGARFLGGEGLHGIVADWNDAGVKTAQGKRWAVGTLRDILLQPRLAALSAHKGEIKGVLKGVTPIIPEEQWRKIHTKLMDPERRTSPGGNTAKYLGSNVYYCPCGATVRVELPRRGRVAAFYRCTVQARAGRQADMHVGRQVAGTDAVVIDKVLAFLSRDDVRAALRPPRAVDGVDTERLQVELEECKNAKRAQAVLHAHGEIDTDQLAAGTAVLNKRIEKLRLSLEACSVTSPLEGLLEADDITAAWNAMGIDRQREVVRRLVTVTILPGAKCGRAPFDPSLISVERCAG